MTDCQLFGLNAGYHHLTNVLLHILNSLLVFFLLLRTTGKLWRSALVAALFAVHPLRVESVVWVTERKDMLSTFFGGLALWAYVSFVATPSWHRYALMVVWLVLGLMAKPMLVTFPFALILLDFWPLDRCSWNSDLKKLFTDLKPLIWEKIPLCVVVLVFSFIAFRAQGIAVAPLDRCPLLIRLYNSSVSYAAYVLKTLWPNPLAFFYPFHFRISPWHIVGSLLLLTGISLLVVRQAHRRPYLPVGWLWFLGILVPVIGLIQIGSHARADRFTYIPSIGLLVMIVWGLAEATQNLSFRRPLQVAGVVLAVSGLGFGAWSYAGYWRTSEILYRHALTVTVENGFCHYALGGTLLSQGKIPEAMTHLIEAVQMRPQNPTFHERLGSAYEKQGHLTAASTEYATALELRPNWAAAYVQFGNITSQLGNPEKAERLLAKATELDPDLATAHSSFGTLLLKRGKYEEAVTQFKRALDIDPSPAEVYNNLGLTLGKQGRYQEAIDVLITGLKRDSSSFETYYNLGLMWGQKGDFERASVEFSKTIHLNPQFARAYGKLGSILLALEKNDEAALRCQQALEIDPNLADAHFVLGKISDRRGEAGPAVDHLSHVPPNDPRYPSAREIIRKWQRNG